MNQEEVLNKLIIEFAKTLEMFDLSPLEARLFVCLYLSEKPLTLDDMSETLGKSKTSMSTCARTLSELNLVSRVWVKGIRKDLYEANSDLFKTFMDSHIKQHSSLINRQKEVISDIEKQLEDNKTLQKQTQNIISFHSDLEVFFKSISMNN